MWLGLVAAGAGAASAQSPREHTRPTPDRSTSVSESQAGELTLTLSEAAVRPIQVWVRTAGLRDASRQTVTARVPAGEAALITVGQRARAFSPETRSRMYQARVTGVTPRGRAGAEIRATLLGDSRDASSPLFVLEIVTEHSEHLSVPNEAIIETGSRRLVYVLQPDGSYAPREIATGVQGELFTEVLDGLKAGEQVVTIGSFFIDAEHKLKVGSEP